MLELNTVEWLQVKIWLNQLRYFYSQETDSEGNYTRDLYRSGKIKEFLDSKIQSNV